MTPPLLSLYLFLSGRLGPVARLWLKRRARRGKEDPARMGERLGIPSAPRPDGRLVWFHAASVGESLSILELVSRIRAARPDLRFLVTTGTVTSAQLMTRRLPPGAVHQYAPIDLVPGLRSFLGHWRPDLAIWIESEIWPAAIIETNRARVPLLLVNARMSERSARGWRRAPLMIGRLLGLFSAIYAQDKTTARNLTALGARDVKVTGTLKEGSAPLPHDDAERQRMAAQFEGRQLWVAASTHEGEEEIVAEAHRAVRRQNPRAILILVPRHPERGPAIAEALRAAGWQVVRRGAGETPDHDTQIYLADTLGELGLWYRLSSVSFIGGSLVPVGGHNPFEPAALGSAIIHGPHVRNFGDGFDRLRAVHAAIAVQDADTLAEAVCEALEPAEAARMAAAAWDLFSAGAEVTDRVVAELRPYLPAPAP
ncbi:3-deoxy-D-manno-octulosonic acid transferase [Paroceanicella profunda]|uniref:3-deoxy-D-manno-octulosonic acid transferase n=1 Tax=Paroceanicella profunda TaxID=2579971 RepID=A0A5B8FQK5_9RHOB|nr:3-deoxy-D-manno-octulosonic acid transferase [Paroceanicella profunda]QDL90936.1 3-deoxy-D-manno-octulosonic acid transferase [Paroceanicella profunda]